MSLNVLKGALALGVVGVIFALFAVIPFYPLFIIWAVNVILSATGAPTIPYTLPTWGAMWVLLIVFGNVTVGAKE